MEENEIKKIISEQLAQEVPLTDIQKKLADECGVKMTFLELRLIASELENIDWNKLNKEEDSHEKVNDSDSGEVDDMAETKDMDDRELEDECAESDGDTVVELSKIARPGAVASGTVRFASGAKAEWLLDQMGRIGLDKAEGKPTQEDIQDFQKELQKLLTGAV